LNDFGVVAQEAEIPAFLFWTAEGPACHLLDASRRRMFQGAKALTIFGAILIIVSA
jgi:hypothetical protein